jgi:alpha-tubulin suppressor-like RCC1 family protein
MKKMKSFLITIAVCLLASNTFAQAIGGGVNNTYYSCNGNVASVGSNNMGQLGNGQSNLNDSVPATVVGPVGVIAIAGSYHVLFVDGDSTVWTAGQNYGGECGNGTNSNVNPPYHITSITGVKKVASGESHSLILKSDGTVWACGSNTNGELGTGNTTASNVPVAIPSLTGIIDISVGSYHSMFLKDDGTVWVCGYNYYGQLGQGFGDTGPHSTPLQVDTFTNAIAVSAGDQGSIVVTADGSVWGFGNDGPYGKFGMGTPTSDNLPFRSTLLTNIVDAVCSRYHSIFIKSDGTVWAAGLNNQGQLGDGTTTNNAAPVQVSGLSGIIDGAVGYSHSIFLKNDGTVWVVGGNAQGQLGDGTTERKLTAIQVSGCSGSGAPNAPTNLELTPMKTQIAGQMELAWTDNSSDEDAFVIERSPDGSNWTEINNTVTLATYTDNGLPDATLFYYRVAAFNTNGTSAWSNVASGTTLTVDIDAPDAENPVTVFPNPADELLVITYQLSGNGELTIYNSFGQHVLAKQLSGNSTTLDISGLAEGVYFMNVYDGAVMHNRKINVQ